MHLISAFAKKNYVILNHHINFTAEIVKVAATSEVPVKLTENQSFQKQTCSKPAVFTWPVPKP